MYLYLVVLVHFKLNSVNIQTYIYHRQRSCGKVMFSQASVILFMGGVTDSYLGRHPSGRHPLGQKPPWADTPPGRHTSLPNACWDTTPPGSHCSGQYASDWNAFLSVLLKESEKEKLS